MTRKDPEKRALLVTQLGRTWERYRLWIIAGALLLSLLIHVGSLTTLSKFQGKDTKIALPSSDKSVKIRVIEKPKKEKKNTKPDVDAKKIVEAPQTPTSPPKKARYLGQVDHKTDKEMRLPEKFPKEKAQDAGPKGQNGAKKSQVSEPRPASKSKPESMPQPSTTSRLKSEFGNFTLSQKPKKPRNNYESLLPSQATDLAGQVNAGYQDHITDDVPIGDRIDLNTSEYRYIGYFTAMRKAIELVWNYPPEASRRGLQGEVALEFAIAKDGRTSHIRVIKSSGYEVLDRAIIDAIRLASPFAPLPAGFGKNKLVITGSFRYILGPYSAH